jgi:hypothetical protein
LCEFCFTTFCRINGDAAHPQGSSSSSSTTIMNNIEIATNPSVTRCLLHLLLMEVGNLLMKFELNVTIE